MEPPPVDLDETVVDVSVSRIGVEQQAEDGEERI